MRNIVLIFIVLFSLSYSYEIEINVINDNDPLFLLLPSSPDLNNSWFESEHSYKGFVLYISYFLSYLLYVLPNKQLFQNTVEKLKTIANILTIKFQSTFILQRSYSFIN